MGKGVKAGKVPVTVRALIARINRKLKASDEVLKATRGEGRARQEFGDFYVLDFNRNAVMQKNVDPEQLGRELGVLKPWEEVQE
jgi:hypothetical protein